MKYCAKWCHQDGNIKSFLTLLSLIRTTNNYSRKIYHWESPGTWKWGWSIPLTTETKANCTHWRYFPFSGQHSRLVSPELLVPPAEKRSLEGKTNLLQHCGLLCDAPILILWCRGAIESAGLHHRDSDYDGERERVCTNQHMDVCRPVSYLQGPTSNPNQ